MFDNLTDREEMFLEMLDIAVKILVENEHCKFCAFRGSEDCHQGCADCEMGIYNGLEFQAKMNIRKGLNELGNRKAS